jgi:low affinity Fe/Cu permease
VSRVVTAWTGSSWAFAVAALVILVWLVTGPVFHYSDTWQLVINTGTTVVTFLMVFLIQRAQNKDSLAIQLKLNELVAAMGGASNRLIDVESLTETELERLPLLSPARGDGEAGRRSPAVALDRGGGDPAPPQAQSPERWPGLRSPAMCDDVGVVLRPAPSKVDGVFVRGLQSQGCRSAVGRCWVWGSCFSRPRAGVGEAQAGQRQRRA